MSNEAWAWGWNALAAVGTLAAVVVALAFSLSESISRWRARRARRRLQWVLLWPFVHNCRAAFSGAAMSPLMHIEIEVTEDLRQLLRFASDQLSKSAKDCQELIDNLDLEAAKKLTVMSAIALQVAGFIDYIESRPVGVKPMVLLGMRDRIKSECDRGFTIAEELCKLSEAKVAEAAGTDIYSYEEDEEGNPLGYKLPTRWPITSRKQKPQ